MNTNSVTKLTNYGNLGTNIDSKFKALVVNETLANDIMDTQNVNEEGPNNNADFNIASNNHGGVSVDHVKTNYREMSKREVGPSKYPTNVAQSDTKLN